MKNPFFVLLAPPLLGYGQALVIIDNQYGNSGDMSGWDIIGALLLVVGVFVVISALSLAGNKVSGYVSGKTHNNRIYYQSFEESLRKIFGSDIKLHRDTISTLSYKLPIKYADSTVGKLYFEIAITIGNYLIVYFINNDREAIYSERYYLKPYNEAKLEDYSSAIKKAFDEIYSKNLYLGYLKKEINNL